MRGTGDRRRVDRERVAGVRICVVGQKAGCRADQRGRRAAFVQRDRVVDRYGYVILRGDADVDLLIGRVGAIADLDRKGCHRGAAVVVVQVQHGSVGNR